MIKKILLLSVCSLYGMNSQEYNEQAQQLTKKLERGMNHLATYTFSYKNLSDPYNQNILNEWVEHVKTLAVLEFMLNQKLVENNNTFSLEQLGQFQESFKLALTAHESKVKIIAFEEIRDMLNAHTLELSKKNS